MCARRDAEHKRANRWTGWPCHGMADVSVHACPRQISLYAVCLPLPCTDAHYKLKAGVSSREESRMFARRCCVPAAPDSLLALRRQIQVTAQPLPWTSFTRLLTAACPYSTRASFAQAPAALSLFVRPSAHMQDASIFMLWQLMRCRLCVVLQGKL